MFCERCHGQSASVHLVKIINGEKTELHLCRECAQKDNQLNCSGDFFRDSFRAAFGNGFMDIFPKYIAYNGDNLFSGKVVEPYVKANHMTGVLDGKQNYEEFREELRPLFSHKVGVTEKNAVKEAFGDSILVKLEKKLAECINLENFEEAAKIRDQIQAYKNRNKK